MTNSMQSVVLLGPPIEIKQKIEEYENTYKTFASLNILKPNLIYTEIRRILLIDLNIDIEVLYKNDRNAFDMILSTFFGQKNPLATKKEATPTSNDLHPNPRIQTPDQDSSDEVEIITLSKCKHRLHTAMVMCFVAHKMYKLVKEDSGQIKEQERFSHLKEYWQTVACNIVNDLNSLDKTGPDYDWNALNTDYNYENRNTETFKNKQKNCGPYKEYLYRKFDRSKEILYIAYKAEAMIFRIVYVLAFAYMLCKFPVYRIYNSEAVFLLWTDYITVYYVIAVLIAQLSNTLIKCLDFVIFEHYREKDIEEYEKNVSSKPVDRFRLRKNVISSVRRYFQMYSLAFWKVVLIFPVLLLEAIRIISEIKTVQEAFGIHAKNSTGLVEYTLSVGIPICMEILYCLLFAISAISSLRFLYIWKDIGFFVHLITKMGKTVLMFIFVFFVFWMVLAVMHVRAYDPKNATLLHTIVSQGKFEIFGEVQDNDRHGTLDACSNFTSFWNVLNMKYEEASCLYRTTIIPFLVFFYIFGTGILLVNLLTAQLTKEYEEEYEKSGHYGGYLKYEQLAKIKSKLLLPPPFSFFYALLRFILALISLISQFCSCCRIVPAIIDFIPRHIWKLLVVLLEGYPFGAVRECEETSETEEKMKEYLENAPSYIWEHLKESIEKFEKNSENRDDVDNYIKAQLELFSILEKEKYNESATNRGKSRMALREEPFSDRDVYPISISRIGTGGAPLAFIDTSSNGSCSSINASH
ncbi:hypothetical protein CAEBREN_15848 [Caenorhabditis brenneri]|uniref:Ion transport domain-containing protein n=1 Tax=Caenorhabditis brenneri TaxID=135651 RepID=G0P7F5_CAEBE|nr:hypothetical protein CAEBREN_15848 [Caenorhabditis brenneri]